MYFYHGTTKQNAKTIITTSLKGSPFCIKEYLKYAIKEKAGSITKGYIDHNGEYKRVKWLGKGIYLFDFLNMKEAIDWSKRYSRQPSSECTALRVKVKKIPEDNVFDLFSYSDVKKIRFSLEEEFMDYLESREDLERDELLSLLSIQTAIIKDLDQLFQKRPFLGGVAVDLYNLIHDNKIKLIRGIYKKGGPKSSYYDVYYCLKDEQLLDSVNNI